jgi:hypothetical protein
MMNNIDLTLSPTPIPRRKENHIIMKQQDETDSFLDPYEHDLTETTEIDETTQFISHTMPLPRKPRKQFSKEKTLQKQNSINKLNSTTLLYNHNHPNYINNNYFITPGISMISTTSSTGISFNNNNNNNKIIKNNFQSTLKVERYIKLKRPQAPPPPPPKSRPDLIETLSSIYLNNKTIETTADLSLSSSSSSSSSSDMLPFKQIKSYEIGFEKLINNNDTIPICSFQLKNDDIYGQPKIEIKNKKHIFNLTSLCLSLILFLICICAITLFQNQVHQFYHQFLNHNKTKNNSINEIYFTAGSKFVKQTVLFCNGPYFSYQINNLIVLPFSLCLVIIFSFFNQNNSCNKFKRPSLLPSFNPFQRRNRLLLAALFCIIANEIFKMIESSLFNDSELRKHSFDSITQLLTSNLESNNNKTSNVDFLRVGFGVEPNDLINFQTNTPSAVQIHTSTSNPLFIPSMLRYSKPKLPPRLKPYDFTKITTTTSYDQLIVNNIANNLYKFRNGQNKTNKIIESFNSSLNNASSKTLFEVSVSLYQNEYIQKAINTIFKNRTFNWMIIIDKLTTLGLMIFEVLVIGMRYYPLIGIMDSNSILCISLASLYMWTDVIYNIAMTGLCEGLKLNVSLDLLKDLRKIFGVGFISLQSNTNDTIDTNYLFSTSRIVYSLVKSLPHFFCLSYVTIRFTATLYFMIYQRFNKNSTSLIVKHRNFNLIYSKIQNKSESSSNFDIRYVRNLFNKTKKPKPWIISIEKTNKIIASIKNKSKSFIYNDDYFRFSTRIVCTFTVCFTLLYYLTCFLIFYGSIFIDLIYFPYVYKNAIIISTCITSFICFSQLIISMKQFKLHLTSLYMGTSEQYISPKSFFTNKKIATSSFNYAGYVVTYTCWGYIFMFILVTFILFQLATIFFLGSSSIIVTFFLVIILPFLISFILIRFVNKFLSSFAAKFCFLQNKSKLLAVKNLKSYSLFLYFKFFYDCFSSIAFCLLRMLKSILLCILFMPRLDYSFVGRGLERMDPGFMSYIGFLHWESHHTNSILISFCDLLKNRNLKMDKYEIKRNRIINRWQLCYLLIKNYKLISYRKK